MWFLTLVVAVGLIGIAAAIALLVKLWRNGRIGKVASIALASSVAFLIYSAMVPSDSFYKKEFEKVTQLPFPASGRVLFKNATYPDLHGDYTSCALIEVSAADYEQLRAKMPPRHSTLGTMGSRCMQRLTASFAGRGAALESSVDDSRGDYMYWALVANRPEVIIHHVTW